MADPVGALGLESGIVIAVLIGAVLILERIGGDDAFLRRGAQVVIAVAIALTVFSGTSAFIRAPEAPENTDVVFGSDGSSEEEAKREELEQFVRESSERASESETIRLGMAIVLAAVGAFALRRLIFIPIALLLAGALLLVLGSSNSGTTDAFTAIYSAYLPGRGDPGQARDIAQFLVLLVGTILLLVFAWLRWESAAPEPVAVESVEPPSDI
jgi:hypothetical protein